VSNVPADRTACLVDDGHATGWHRRPVGAIFKNGKWTNGRGGQLPFTPTYWTAIESTPDAE
jgi:hypothetical protein